MCNNFLTGSPVLLCIKYTLKGDFVLSLTLDQKHTAVRQFHLSAVSCQELRIKEIP